MSRSSLNEWKVQNLPSCCHHGSVVSKLRIYGGAWWALSERDEAFPRRQHTCCWVLQFGGPGCVRRLDFNVRKRQCAVFVCTGTVSPSTCRSHRVLQDSGIEILLSWKVMPALLLALMKPACFHSEWFVSEGCRARQCCTGQPEILFKSFHLWHEPGFTDFPHI